MLNHTSKEAMVQDRNIPDMLSPTAWDLSMANEVLSKRLINPTPGVPQALGFQVFHNGVGRKMQRTSGISVQHQILPI